VHTVALHPLKVYGPSGELHGVTWAVPAYPSAQVAFTAKVGILKEFSITVYGALPVGDVHTMAWQPPKVYGLASASHDVTLAVPAYPFAQAALTENVGPLRDCSVTVYPVLLGGDAHKMGWHPLKLYGVLSVSHGFTLAVP